MPYDFLQMLPAFTAASMLLGASFFAVWILPWSDAEVKRCMEEVAGFRKAFSMQRLSALACFQRLEPSIAAFLGRRHG